MTTIDPEKGEELLLPLETRVAVTSPHSIIYAYSILKVNVLEKTLQFSRINENTA